MSRSRRGGRPLGSRSRLSRSLIAAAALHREEPGETEDEEVKRTDGHLVGSDGDPNSSLARSSDIQATAKSKRSHRTRKEIHTD